MNNLYGLFKDQFSQYAHRSCILSPQGEKLFSFAQIDEQSALMSGVLVSLDVNRGDRVIVQVDKSVQMMILYLACLRQGIIFIPLNTAYTANEMDYFIANAQPKLIVGQGGNVSKLQTIADTHRVEHVLTLEGMGPGSICHLLQSSCADHSIVKVATDTVAAVLYTSGTTGLSKGAMLTHKNLSSNALALQQIWGWRDDDILLHALPIFHAHGLFVGIHLALLNASPMLFLPTFDAVQVIDNLPKATVFMGVPTYYVRLLANPEFSGKSCSNIRLFISGSAPLSEETFVSFAKRVGQNILERYGMTEAVMITSNPLQGPRIPGTVGYALPDVNVRVVDKSGRQITSGDIGELEITGPNVFPGYWQMPEKTQQEFTQDGFFRTGDLATITADGRVSIAGRSKDLIISGGYNVYPKEIEDHINRIDGVHECAVIGIPHSDFGEAVAAVVILEGARSVSQQSITKALQPLLARFKIPKYVFFADTLPRNAMGKVQKKILRTQHIDAGNDLL